MSETHVPVLLAETLDNLKIQDAIRMLDVTLGLGGHSKAMLETAKPNAELVAIDADSENIERTKVNLSTFADRVTIHHSNFLHLPELNLGKFNAVLADLGLSSPHLDELERGFSFRDNAPLDMRFDRTSGHSAAEVVRMFTEEQIADLLYHYGEVRQSRKLASVIKERLPATTLELVECINSIAGHHAKNLYAPVFQAFRIAVNSELQALDVLLQELPNLLAVDGRCVVLTYHSLEDRAVKKAFKALCEPEIDDYTGAVKKEAPFALINKKPIIPTESEVASNPRARSAKLRAITRVY